MATRQGSANKAHIVAVMGGSGAGKSSFVKGELARRKPARLMIWDFMREYGDHGHVVRTTTELLQAVSGKRFAVVFEPSQDPSTAKKQFDVFCRAAHAIGDVVMVAEELSFVTTASKAPVGWSMCTLTGRHKGMTIYGLSQRPAAVDKNFWSNATHVRTGRLNYDTDVTTLAKVLRVKPAEIDALLPLQFIERNMSTGVVSRGSLSGGGKPGAGEAKAGTARGVPIGRGRGRSP